jgi:hypothetical protein
MLLGNINLTKSTFRDISKTMEDLKSKHSKVFPQLKGTFTGVFFNALEATGVFIFSGKFDYFVSRTLYRLRNAQRVLVS